MKEIDTTAYCHVAFNHYNKDIILQSIQSQWRTQEFCSGGGGSTNSVEDRENGDLGVVAP